MGQLIQLLDDGAGVQISTMLIAKEANGKLMVDTLLSADGTGSLTLLQCGSDTGIWQAVPFYIPSDTNNMEVPSFTLRFKAVSDDPNESVDSCQLHIISSGSVEAFSNGSSATIDQVGRWYQADTFGVVSIIVSTSDMASFTFQVNQFQANGQTSVTVQSKVLNPNGKLNEKLVKINHKEDLLNARTQTGDLLITPGTVNDQDAEQAAQMISQLNKQQILLGQPGLPLKKFHGTPKIYNPKNLRPKILAGRLSQGLEDDPNETSRFLDKMSVSSWYDPWGFFSWVYDKAKQATKWVLTTIGTSAFGPLANANICSYYN